MNRIVLLMATVIVATLTGFAQSVDSCCRNYVKLADEIKEQQDSIKNLQSEIAKLRKEWQRICEEAMATQVIQREEIEQLIDMTDGESETKLMNQLNTFLKNYKFVLTVEDLVDDAASPVEQSQKPSDPGGTDPKKVGGKSQGKQTQKNPIRIGGK